MCNVLHLLYFLIFFWKACNDILNRLKCIYTTTVCHALWIYIANCSNKYDVPIVVQYLAPPVNVGGLKLPSHPNAQFKPLCKTQYVKHELIVHKKITSHGNLLVTKGLTRTYSIKELHGENHETNYICYAGRYFVTNLSYGIIEGAALGWSFVPSVGSKSCTYIFVFFFHLCHITIAWLKTYIIIIVLASARWLSDVTYYRKHVLLFECVRHPLMLCINGVLVVARYSSKFYR